MKYGRRAEAGSIERIGVDPQSLEVSYQTINGNKPTGICGTAFVDALAGLLRAGMVDQRGSLRAESQITRMRVESRENREFIIVWKEEAGLPTDIVITQDDIREIQKAKAAIRAACEILLRRKGISPGDIASLIIAGAFGQYLDPESARTIGMYPPIPPDRVKVVGNAAGAGARMALISRKARKEAEDIPLRVRYHELALDPDFPREYAKSMWLPYLHEEGHS